MKFSTKYKPIPHYPPYLLLHYQFSADIQQIWKKTQAHCIFVASIFVIRLQILIFKIVSFPHVIANKILHVTILLLVYFCDQFVAPEICHRRRHCSVC